jgi:hypothetical protein
MHGIGISRGVNGNCGDAQLFAGPQNAEGDFAAVGDEYL